MAIETEIIANVSEIPLTSILVIAVCALGLGALWIGARMVKLIEKMIKSLGS